MARHEKVIEQLKMQDHILWVRKMNNIGARAEKIVLSDIIYSL